MAIRFSADVARKQHRTVFLPFSVDGEFQARRPHDVWPELCGRTVNCGEMRERGGDRGISRKAFSASGFDIGLRVKRQRGLVLTVLP